MLDLLGGSDGPINIISTTLNASEKHNFGNVVSETIPNNQDLLDLLGGIDLSSPVSTNPNDISANTNGNNILSMIPSSMPSSNSLVGVNNILGGNLFDDLTNNSTTTSTTNGVKLTALDKNGLNVILVPQKNVGDSGNNGCLRVIMSATNNSINTLDQYLFQAAVPKSFTLQMLSPSGSVLPPGGTITQEMRLTNSAKVCYIELNQHFINYYETLIGNHMFSLRQCSVCDFVYPTM